MKRAVIYQVCRDKRYFKWAQISARSSKKQMPDVDTVLITDLSLPKYPGFDVVIPRKPVKALDVLFPPLMLLSEGKYDSAFYTGADSYVCKPLYDVFELVETPKFDMALVHTHSRAQDRKYPACGVPEAFAYYGSALVAFRDCEKVRRFFDDWKTLFDEHKMKYPASGSRFTDQGPLRVALWRSNLNVATLEHQYCTRPGNVVVSQWVRLITTPKTDSPEGLARRANRHAPHTRFLNAEGRSKILIRLG